MGKIKISHIVLILLFLLSIQLRMYYSFQTPYFSSDESYYTVRTIEHIQNTGYPIIDDPLKDQSTVIMSPPLFHYIMAGFAAFIPIELVGKVLPSIFVSFIVFIVYLIAQQLTDGNESASLCSALLATFIPVVFRKLAVNSLVPYSLAVPLIFFLLYCFMRIRNETYLYMYLGILVALPFLHPVAMILIPIFCVYMLMVKMEKIRQLRAELELIIFSSLYLIWVLFLFYKNAFLLYGPSIIWQNLPTIFLDNFFTGTNTLQALYNIGLLPVIFGSYVVYKSVFIDRNTKLYLFISCVMTTAILLYLRIIELELGLLFLGITLAILFARYYESAMRYIEKTSFPQCYTLILFATFFIFIVSAVSPSIAHAQQTVDNTVTQEEIVALLWISDNTQEGATVLGMPHEGNLIAAIGKRKVVADSQYLLTPDINERIDDINDIYGARYKTEALTKLTTYGVDYIYLSPSTKEAFEIESLEYALDDDCFELVYDKGVSIYESKCVLEE